jgi:hypothetical protein
MTCSLDLLDAHALHHRAWVFFVRLEELQGVIDHPFSTPSAIMMPDDAPYAPAPKGDHDNAATEGQRLRE